MGKLNEEQDPQDPPNSAESTSNVIEYKSNYVSLTEISERFNIQLSELEKVCEKYPVRIPRYYFNLIRSKDDGIYKQCIPDLKELTDTFGDEDPLHEEPEKQVRKVPNGMTHRYPNRVLELVSNQCAMYCRFCTRKRKVGDPKRPLKQEYIEKGINYIKENPQINDVILSGGDPFMLNISSLEKILQRLHPILKERNGIIRIGTRVPCTFPQRVTQDLCDMLKKYHPIYVNTHFNHPYELTEESKKACEMLANAGIPLGCQTVLLKGVNDDIEIMKELMQGLVSMRVKPYYLYQCDPVKGASHFRTKVEKGIEIYKALRGYTSGLAVPLFVIDAPGGGGKVPVLPDYVKSIKKDKVIFKNYEGKTFEYLQPEY